VLTQCDFCPVLNCNLGLFPPLATRSPEKNKKEAAVQGRGGQ